MWSGAGLLHMAILCADIRGVHIMNVQDSSAFNQVLLTHKRGYHVSSRSVTAGTKQAGDALSREHDGKESSTLLSGNLDSNES